MALFGKSSFTAPDDTDLTTIGVEKGGPWNTIGDSCLITSNRARSGTGGAGTHYLTVTEDSADGRVQADFFVASLPLGATAYVAGRWDVDADTRYQWFYEFDGLSWILEKVVSGIATQLGTFAQVLVLGNTYRAMLKMTGTTIAGYVDGVQRVSVTDSAIAAAGKCGFFLNTGGATTGIHVEKLRAWSKWRLYFPVSGAAGIAPNADVAWEYTSEITRTPLNHVKGSTPITAGTQIGAWTAGQDAVDRQLISYPMLAGVVFDSGVVTVNGQLMVREHASGDNTDKLKMGLRVLSLDGGTVRATLLAVANYAGAAEFINNDTMRNKTFADGDTITAGYTGVDGDRVVLELGYSDNAGATPEGSAKWGENATDLPVDETQTTNGAGWIDIDAPLDFYLYPLEFIVRSQALPRASRY